MSSTKAAKTTSVKDDLAEQYRLNGNHCLEKGKFKEAEALYTKSLNAKKSAVTFANRAQLHIQCNRLDDAIRDAREALELDPKYQKARFRLGRALLMRGSPEEAMAELEKCRIAEPNNPQIRQEIDKCKKALNTPTTSLSCTEIVVPQRSFTHLSLIGWPDEQLRLAFWNEPPVFGYDSIEDLQSVLNTAKAIVGPIAHVVVQEYDVSVNGKIYKFFRSLNPKLLDGCLLEVLGVRAQSEQQFDQFMALFRPISVHVAPLPESAPWHSYDKFPCDFSSAILRVPALRSAKHLMFCIPSSIFPFPSLNISDLMDWLHSRSAFPPDQDACNEPPTQMTPQLEAVMDGNITSVLHENNNHSSEFASVWRYPAHRVLQFHARSLVQDSNKGSNEYAQKQHAVVEQFINVCNEKFREATKPISYTVKMFCIISKPQIKISPRRFTNALGEQLLVSRLLVQHSETTVSDPTMAHVVPFIPPLELVLIQRYHSQPKI